MKLQNTNIQFCPEKYLIGYYEYFFTVMPFLLRLSYLFVLSAKVENSNLTTKIKAKRQQSLCMLTKCAPLSSDKN